MLTITANSVARRARVHFGTLLQADLFAAFAGQRVLYTNLRMIGPSDADLCCFRFAGKTRRKDLFDDSGQCSFSFGVPIYGRQVLPQIYL